MIAAATVGFAAMSLLTDSVLAVLVPACCSFYLLGEVFPVGDSDYSLYDAGFWLATGSAAAMSVAGVLAVADTANLARDIANSPRASSV